MSKRGAISDLNDRNWDEEEEPEEAGVFKQATEDVLQQRVMKKAKRRTVADDGSKPAAFSGFAGLGGKSAPNVAGQVPSFAAASSINGTQSVDSKESSSYLSFLKSLNESVLAWIKQHVEENPYIILSPIFKDYEVYLSSIEKSPSAVGRKEVTRDPTGSGTSQPEEKGAKFSFGSASSEEKGAKFSFGSASSEEKGAKFSFGLAASEACKGFSFAPASGQAAQNDLKSGQKTETVPNNKPAFSFGLSSQSSGFSFTSTASSGATASLGAGSSQDGDTKDDDEYVPPKPEVKEIVEEGALHSIRCKLYHQKDGKWVDRGVGHLHLKPVAERKTQVLVRADTNLGNILLNVMLSSSMPVTRQGKNNVVVVCVPNPAIDSKGEEEKTPVPMLLRVKTQEEADDLYKIIDERKKLL
ncbi:nuclear pore complex protein Nup50-like [Physella acuta]|uniref:nuclear pore complex protein Nup50-like n=1 Tax=Physella acuta TaxID=109671 RepID=UPI0027DB5628|nr:nuclear pore complex protein Nup50-like [Physella acuta]XP_059156450.1 nuclear pore complex protein Nup50-like [Physella acuta]XP_059156451.1 nuclear pore complex protein Nup50-like [Physella acuta]